MQPIKRILIADDHDLILAAVSRLLSTDFIVVGQATDGRSLVAEAKRLKPDLIILDIGMPFLNGIEAAVQITEAVPRARLIFLTQQLDLNYIQSAFRAGAKGFVAKQSAAVELLEAIRVVNLNRFYVSPLATVNHPNLQLDASVNPADVLTERLTPRQREVLQLIAEGMSAKEIGRHLKITAKTADFHKGCIMDTLGLRSTAELTRYALTHGIVS